jgi:hypothetical protein
MKNSVCQHLLLLFVLITCMGTVMAQTSSSGTEPKDDSSQRTDESEEAYRRRMELEDARDQDTFSNVSYSSQAEEEAIDKLPEESKKNIRDQITDIIIENGQWEPKDVLDEYPYKPTEAAEKDPVLMEQEQEAWAEQVDKYHEREASAFGATRPPMPGDGNQQAQAGTSGEGKKGENGEGEAGQKGGQSGEGGSDTAGSYQPGSRQDGDEVSTAGVSESALDFLRGQQGQGSSGPGGNATREQPTSVAGSGQQQGQDPESDTAEETAANQAEQFAGDGDEAQDEAQAQAPGQTGEQQRSPDGSLPIEQLDQMRGIAGQTASGETGNPSAAQQSQAQQPGEAEATDGESMAQAAQVQLPIPGAEPADEANQEQIADAPEQDQQEQMAQTSEEAQPETWKMIGMRGPDKQIETIQSIG